MVSVITPASRGVKDLSNLFRDFYNQTLKSFEHILVYDGEIPPDVQRLADHFKKLYNLKVTSIPKDMAGMLGSPMLRSPGTKPRNHGVSIAKFPYVVFCDDDNRFKDTYLETLINGMNEKRISVVQVACAESRIRRNGDSKRITIIPEIGLPMFPMVCHVDTACFMVPRKWALKDPWGYEGNTHDYSFLKRIIEKNNPEILMKNGVQVDLDGLFVKGVKDWVTLPPFYRG